MIYRFYGLLPTPAVVFLDHARSLAIELLRKITDKAANKESEGLAWLMLGHAYAAAKDTSHARESYEKAKSLVAPDHAIARQADGAIARLH
jgi:cytochrome c-type biogenesis protein CcmH/NrfG